MQPNTTNEKCFNNHYLGGWVTDEDITPSFTEANLQPMSEAAASSRPCQHQQHNSALCLGSCEPFKDDNGSLFIIIGTPRWTDASLAEMSNGNTQAAVLCSAYEKHGDNFLSYLQGGFAFVIVDQPNQRVVGGIDRLGQHTLYYHTESSELVFGSSASIVLSHQNVQRDISHQGIYNYVYFHMVPSPDAIFHGVHKLQAGHTFSYQNNQLSLRNYYKPQFTEHTDSSFDSLAATLPKKLKQAVINAIPTDKKVGAFLSGGLDSSTVAGMLSEVSDTTAEAFSIGFSAKGYDEMEYARLTAKHFGIHLNEYYVTPEDVVEALPLVAASYDEPFGNSSALPAYFCAKVAKEHGIDCLLAGDGGDEFFAGNERYAKQNVFEHYSKIPAVLRSALIEPLVALLPDAFPKASKAKSYIDQANIPLPDRLQTYNFLHRHQADEMFNPEFASKVNTERPLTLQRDVYNTPAGASTLNRMLYLDWQFTLADNDLRKVSHMCSLANVEVTYPMLDDDLVAFSCQVPSHFKLKGDDLRHFYKQALTGWLHDGTINKPKQGFGLPFGVWMETHKPLQEMAYDNLLALKQRHYFKPEFIDKTIHMHRNEHASYYGVLVWVLMTLEIWLDNHS